MQLLCQLDALCREDEVYLVTKDTAQPATLFREIQRRCHRLLHGQLCVIALPACFAALDILPFFVDQEIIACHMAHAVCIPKLIGMRDLPMQHCLKAEAICEPVDKGATVHQDLLDLPLHTCVSMTIERTQHTAIMRAGSRDTS